MSTLTTPRIPEMQSYTPRKRQRLSRYPASLRLISSAEDPSTDRQTNGNVAIFILQLIRKTASAYSLHPSPSPVGCPRGEPAITQGPYMKEAWLLDVPTRSRRGRVPRTVCVGANLSKRGQPCLLSYRVQKSAPLTTVPIWSFRRLCISAISFKNFPGCYKSCPFRFEVHVPKQAH